MRLRFSIDIEAEDSFSSDFIKHVNLEASRRSLMRALVPEGHEHRIHFLNPCLTAEAPPDVLVLETELPDGTTLRAADIQNTETGEWFDASKDGWVFDRPYNEL